MCVGSSTCCSFCFTGILNNTLCTLHKNGSGEREIETESLEHEFIYAWIYLYHVYIIYVCNVFFSWMQYCSYTHIATNNAHVYIYYWRRGIMLRIQKNIGFNELRVHLRFVQHYAVRLICVDAVLKFKVNANRETAVLRQYNTRIMMTAVWLAL